MTWLGYFKMLFKGKAVADEAIKQAGEIGAITKKNSWKSTEFVTALLVGLGAIAAQAGGLLPAPWGPVVLSVSGALYAISRGFAKNADPNGGTKAGVETTEFWVAMISQVGAIAAAAANAVPAETAAILLMISNGAYGLSRGLAKGGAQPIANP